MTRDLRELWLTIIIGALLVMLTLAFIGMCEGQPKVYYQGIQLGLPRP